MCAEHTDEQDTTWSPRSPVSYGSPDDAWGDGLGADEINGLARARRGPHVPGPRLFTLIYQDGKCVRVIDGDTAEAPDA